MKANLKKVVALCLLIGSIVPARSQSSLYSMASVPDVVKANAEIVVHSENITLNIESLDKSVYKVHRIYTVLNENGRSGLTFYESTNSQRVLADAELKVYDANGRQVGKYKKKDMVTESFGEGLIDDGYVTWYRVQTATYPITIEVNYEVKYKGTFFLPDYYFVRRKTGVMASDYTITAPAEINLRFKPVQTDIRPTTTTEGNSKIYRWAVSSLPPYQYEDGSSSGGSVPHITVVADQFSYGGYKGDFSSWQNFGKWYYELCAGLDRLSPEREEFFRNLVKGAADDREKVKRIYQYLQDNFRFVSIQLGVGGFRPMSAAFTDKQKYGDCKALSNFTKAALSAVGVKSYLSVINRETNGEPADPQFPANVFNHVILCVPVAKDSVWLECTSSTAEFGELETSTENRFAVVVNEQGGFLVATPKTNYTSNYIGSHSIIKMDDDLSAITTTRYHTRGHYSELMSDLYKYNKDDQKRLLVNYLGYKQPDDFVFVKEGKHGSSLKLAISKVPEFISGDKLFINHRMQKIWTEKLPKSENRKLDYYFDYPFEKRDTTVYQLPAGSTMDVLPKLKKLEAPHSLYEVEYRYDQATNEVSVFSTLILREHHIPAADYAAVKKFFDEVMSDHTQKIVIKKAATEKKAF